MRVRDVMTEHVCTVRPETLLPDVARMMRDEDIGAVPVEEDDRLVGMVTDRDIVVRGVADGSSVDMKHARDVMSPRVLYCTEDEDIDDVLKNMGQQQIRRLPVVDQHKRLVGVVSLGDLSFEASPKDSGKTLKEISQP